MANFDFQILENAALEDAKILTDGLATHTAGEGFTGAFQNFAILARDNLGVVRGGVTGNSRFELMYVSILWVDPAVRGNGLGRTLMAMVEQEAKRRGCHTMGLSTLTFQAPRFYERLGYREFGRIGGLGRDQTISQVWYTKTL